MKERNSLLILFVALSVTFIVKGNVSELGADSEKLLDFYLGDLTDKDPEIIFSPKEKQYSDGTPYTVVFPATSLQKLLLCACNKKHAACDLIYEQKKDHRQIENVMPNNHNRRRKRKVPGSNIELKCRLISNIGKKSGRSTCELSYSGTINENNLEYQNVCDFKCISLKWTGNVDVAYSGFGGGEANKGEFCFNRKGINEGTTLSEKQAATTINPKTTSNGISTTHEIYAPTTNQNVETAFSSSVLLTSTDDTTTESSTEEIVTTSSSAPTRSAVSTPVTQYAESTNGSTAETGSSESTVDATTTKPQWTTTAEIEATSTSENNIVVTSVSPALTSSDKDITTTSSGLDVNISSTHSGNSDQPTNANQGEGTTDYEDGANVNNAENDDDKTQKSNDINSGPGSAQTGNTISSAQTAYSITGILDYDTELIIICVALAVSILSNVLLFLLIFRRRSTERKTKRSKYNAFMRNSESSFTTSDGVENPTYLSVESGVTPSVTETGLPRTDGYTRNLVSSAINAASNADNVVSNTKNSGCKPCILDVEETSWKYTAQDNVYNTIPVPSYATVAKKHPDQSETKESLYCFPQELEDETEITGDAPGYETPFAAINSVKGSRYGQRPKLDLPPQVQDSTGDCAAGGVSHNTEPPALPECMYEVPVKVRADSVIPEYNDEPIPELYCQPSPDVYDYTGTSENDCFYSVPPTRGSGINGSKQ